jgi:hypothetical protein
MTQYIDKSVIVAEIERLIRKYSGCPTHTFYEEGLKEGRLIGYNDVLFKINALEVKEVTTEKTDWSPSKKQMESLKDMLKYNIGVFDYQKFMEVNSLYDDLTKMLGYETDR